MSEPEHEDTSVLKSAKVRITGHAADVRIFAPLPDDHPFYAKIGRIIAEWSQLEHWLDIIIWELSALNNAFGSAITGQFTGQGQRFNAIEALAIAKSFDEATIATIGDLGRRTGQISRLRNRYVHDAWFVETTKGDVARFESLTPITKGDYGFRVITDDDVATDLRKIQKKIAEITELRNVLLHKRKTSP